MKLPIVHISTVYLLAFYFIIILSIIQTMGFYYDISTHACNLFWSCSHHIIFTLWLCLLHIVFKICQLYQILHVFICVHLCTYGGQRSTQNVLNHSPSSFLRQDLPLNLELTDFTRLVGPGDFFSLPPLC